MACAKNEHLIDALNIRAIINVCATSFPNAFEHDPSFSYFNIFENDVPSTNLRQYFDATFKFIEKHVKDCGVLIHCAAGISRSTTILIAYLMKKQDLSFNDALKFAQTMHPNTDPNFGFLIQLQQYHDELKEEKS